MTLQELHLSNEIRGTISNKYNLEYHSKNQDEQIPEKIAIQPLYNLVIFSLQNVMMLLPWCAQLSPVGLSVVLSPTGLCATLKMMPKCVSSVN